jgi:AcrR family transcriptional regulator
MARTHGWSGNPPRTDDEAVAQILDATRRCRNRKRNRTTVTEVARELGVSRATVYRYFPSTEALLFASSVDAEGGFLDRLAAHVAGVLDPVEIVIEGIAFTVEQLPRERYLSVVLSSRHDDLPSGVSPQTVRAFGRAVLARIGTAWADKIDEPTMEELIEWTVAILHWILLESATRSRTGLELRRYLDRWLGPALREHLPARVSADRSHTTETA